MVVKQEDGLFGVFWQSPKICCIQHVQTHPLQVFITINNHFQLFLTPLQNLDSIA